MVAERECCPFLTFEFTAQPNMGPVLVRVTSPAGAKGFLETILCNPKRLILGSLSPTPEPMSKKAASQHACPFDNISEDRLGTRI